MSRADSSLIVLVFKLMTLYLKMWNWLLRSPWFYAACFVLFVFLGRENSNPVLRFFAFEFLLFGWIFGGIVFVYKTGRMIWKAEDYGFKAAFAEIGASSRRLFEGLGAKNALDNRNRLPSIGNPYTHFLLGGVLATTTIFLLLNSYTIYGAVANYLIAINTAILLVSFYDKQIAGSEEATRVPEAILQIFGFLGGSGGLLLSMLIRRHKTSKASFRSVVAIILVPHVFLVVPIILRTTGDHLIRTADTYASENTRKKPLNKNTFPLQAAEAKRQIDSKSVNPKAERLEPQAVPTSQPYTLLEPHLAKKPAPKLEPRMDEKNSNAAVIQTVLAEGEDCLSKKKTDCAVVSANTALRLDSGNRRAQSLKQAAEAEQRRALDSITIR